MEAGLPPTTVQGKPVDEPVQTTNFAACASASHPVDLEQSQWHKHKLVVHNGATKHPTQPADETEQAACFLIWTLISWYEKQLWVGLTLLSIKCITLFFIMPVSVLNETDEMPSQGGAQALHSSCWPLTLATTLCPSPLLYHTNSGRRHCTAVHSIQGAAERLLAQALLMG
jgi:hypothetical protein